MFLDYHIIIVINKNRTKYYSATSASALWCSVISRHYIYLLKLQTELFVKVKKWKCKHNKLIQYSYCFKYIHLMHNCSTVG